MTKRKVRPKRHERLKDYKPWGLSWDVGITLPTKATDSAADFFRAWAKTNSLMAFIFSVTGHVSKTSKMAREFREDVELGIAKAGLEALPAKPAGLDALEVLGRHLQLLWELLLCRHVDNFNTYLGALALEMFLSRPQMLKAKDAKVDVDLLLTKSSLPEVIKAVADQRVHQLMYKSFDDVVLFFKDRGLEVGTADDIKRIKEANEIRNISIHNGCIINETYCRRMNLDNGSVGRIRTLNIYDVEPLAIVLGDLVNDLDAAAANHFGLVTAELEVNPLAYEGPDEEPSDSER